jgi:FdrA protein
VLDAARDSGKPVVAYLPGWHGTPPAGVRVVTTLEAAALALVGAVGGKVRAFGRGAAARRRRSGHVRGLFTGGTLCEEARAIVGDGGGRGHRFVDFGDAEYTRGRPHPIIDPTLRNAAVARAGAERAAGVVLVDVILGDGAHPDPGGALAEAIRRARGRRTALEVVVHVVGTDEDPQGLADQEGKLRKAGARVCPTSRLAAELARDLAGGGRRGR